MELSLIRRVQPFGSFHNHYASGRHPQVSLTRLSLDAQVKAKTNTPKYHCFLKCQFLLLPCDLSLHRRYQFKLVLHF